jgi:hypothetical protein
MVTCGVPAELPPESPPRPNAKNARRPSTIMARMMIATDQPALDDVSVFGLLMTVAMSVSYLITPVYKAIGTEKQMNYQS